MPWRTIPLLRGGDGPDKDKPMAQLAQWYEEGEEGWYEVDTAESNGELDIPGWKSMGVFDMTKDTRSGS